MPLILERDQVCDVFKSAAERKWVLPAFNAENRTTVEAILSAALDYSRRIDMPDMPVIVGITNTYWHRAQSALYTHTGDWRVGLKMFINDVAVLSSKDSPYGKLKVMTHLDHIQWDSDAELFAWDMNAFSSIMYDASTLSIEENMRKTSEFVEKFGKQILVEGACDEIAEASENERMCLTDPDVAEKYFRNTGVDIVVANLGTEHRASAAELKYHPELAAKIKAKIGTHICLHGTSSVSQDQIMQLFDDGVCKVNIWTALERDSSPALFREMVKNAAMIVGPEAVAKMISEGLLGSAADAESKASVTHYTTTFRQNCIFEQMKKIIGGFLEMWYTA